ncbi:MAG TPA: flagellar basal body P-ring protein FlgI [Nitrospiraceae bacterium]|nr:flagellar basal body P-ring protein FlgI [Nitrospiraceae bacterium]
MMHIFTPARTWLLVATFVVSMTSVCEAQFLRLRDICRVKGQEENSLHGLGLVVGLKGTGDGDVPATRALSKMMELMGSPVASKPGGEVVLDELKNAKNVALAFVTATVPAQGARQGETLHCTVNAISAKSLEGGHLMLTPLLGPRPGHPRIYAFAQGSLVLDKSGPVTSAKVHDGARLEENFANAFEEDGYITLVLDKNFASFQTALEVEELVNDPPTLGLAEGPGAKALDQVNIRVRIPEKYRDDRVAFVAQVLDAQIAMPRHDARVVIDQRNGNIVIGDNVMVGRVAVTHRNLNIETGNNPADGSVIRRRPTGTGRHFDDASESAGLGSQCPEGQSRRCDGHHQDIGTQR